MKIKPSVIYRTGKLNRKDYEEAIEALQNALDQGNFLDRGCSVCGDSSHYANTCHHNPLVMARRAAKRGFTMDNSLPYRCFHCGEVFYTTREAREHFGKRESIRPRCIK